MNFSPQKPVLIPRSVPENGTHKFMPKKPVLELLFPEVQAGLAE